MTDEQAAFVSALQAKLKALSLSGDQFAAQQFALIQTMMAENRPPTQAEWDALNGVMQSEIDTLHSQATPE